MRATIVTAESFGNVRAGLFAAARGSLRAIRAMIGSRAPPKRSAPWAVQWMPSERGGSRTSTVCWMSTSVTSWGRAAATIRYHLVERVHSCSRRDLDIRGREQDHVRTARGENVERLVERLLDVRRPLRRSDVQPNGPDLGVVQFHRPHNATTMSGTCPMNHRGPETGPLAIAGRQDRERRHLLAARARQR